jgi:hypothetical protein
MSTTRGQPQNGGRLKQPHPQVLTISPADLAPLRVAECLFALLLSAGATPQDAAWTSDAVFLYILAYCLEASVVHAQEETVPDETIDRAEIAKRLRMLPKDQFPNTVEYAQELTAGTDHDRFDYTLRLMLRGLAPAQIRDRHLTQLKVKLPG